MCIWVSDLWQGCLCPHGLSMVCIQSMVSVVSLPADFSSGNPPIPFRFMVFQLLLASHCTLHVDSNAILRDVTH